MNWNRVRQTNARRSAAKARRELAEAARKRVIAEHGGPITLDELRNAVCTMYPPAPGGYVNDRLVWSFRSREWVVWDGHAVPFVSYRQDPQYIRTGYGETAIPMTPAARKWYFDNLGF